MSMIWPPHSVKIVSTPSFLSALATRWPPETRAASLLFGRSVSSAVVAIGAGADAVLTAFMLPPASGNVSYGTKDTTRRPGRGGTGCSRSSVSSHNSPAAEASGCGAQPCGPDRVLIPSVLDATRREVPHAHRLEDKQTN